MRKRDFVTCAIAAVLFYASPSAMASDTFEVGKGSFLLNGEPFVIKAAELHYPRIPKEYWEQRIQMSKALGMNTICLYTFWNFHEPTEGKFDFTGERDLREFIMLCEKNGMKVILRPGPYVCAEWEMGGLPWWLLKNKDIRLRENDPVFMEKVDGFFNAVAGQTADLTADKGGPIIMVQVENEYGAYGEDKEYVGAIRDQLRKYYGDDVVMFQCDWSSNFTLNGLDDLLWTMNFGTGADIDSQFQQLRELRPDSPLMCSEFWSGWFDKWGANHETRSADEMIAGIDSMLSKDISFSLYMTHGGTNWGHWAGANSPGYAPDVTSYDYDAPINENGMPTEKFWALRKTLGRYNEGYMLPDLPAVTLPAEVEKFELTEVAPLFENLPDAIKDNKIRPMEDYDQGFGSVLYSTTMPAMEEGAVLRVTEPHDFAQIFINGEYIGKLDRRLSETEISLPETSEGTRLDILVEATGRINFGRAIKDYKGITEEVMLVPANGGEAPVSLPDWCVYLLPDELEFYEGLTYVPIAKIEKGTNKRYPIGVYRGTFDIEKVADTFLNFETWGKGLVYLNGRGLGRIWEIGPQQTLYAPAPWLKEGENELLVFDILGPLSPVSEGRPEHINDMVRNEEEVPVEVKTMDLESLEPVYDGEFSVGSGWQQIMFDHRVEGEYMIIEMLSGQTDEAAIAEICLLDENGDRLQRENWKGVYADSENPDGNHTIDKIFDLQESTYWSSAPGTSYPHAVVIDLGGTHKVKGMQYLPRMEAGAPGVLKDVRIYIDKKNPVK